MHLDRQGSVRHLQEAANVSRKITRATVHSVIATSGTAAALAGAAQSLRLTRTGGVSQGVAEKLARRLAKMTARQRASIKGINPKRAQIIVEASGQQATAAMALRATVLPPDGRQPATAVRLVHSADGSYRGDFATPDDGLDRTRIGCLMSTGMGSVDVFEEEDFVAGGLGVFGSD